MAQTWLPAISAIAMADGAMVSAITREGGSSGRAV